MEVRVLAGPTPAAWGGLSGAWRHPTLLACWFPHSCPGPGKNPRTFPQADDVAQLMRLQAPLTASLITGAQVWLLPTTLAGIPGSAAECHL